MNLVLIEFELNLQTSVLRLMLVLESNLILETLISVFVTQGITTGPA
jgi:hypothetical protein